MKRLFTNLTLLFISTCIGVVILESGLRMFAPQIINLNVGATWSDKDPVIGGIPKKKAVSRMRVLHAFDAEIRTNSQRLRADREYAVPKKEGTTRILFLGDSFVFGWGVENDETMPAQLESYLKEKGYDVEVLNAGVYAFETSHYVLWNRRMSDYSPDLTILGFCLENDFYVHKKLDDMNRQMSKVNVPEDQGPYVSESFLTDFKNKYIVNSHLVALIRDQLYIRFPDIRKWLFKFGVNNKRNIFLNEYPPFLRDQISEARSNLSLLSQEVSAGGSSLLITAIPLREQIYSASEISRFEGFDSYRPNRLLGEIASEIGADYFDPTASMEKIRTKNGKRFYFEIDPHLSPEGNAKVAELLGEKIIRDYKGVLRR